MCAACEDFLQGEAGTRDERMQGRGDPRQPERRERMPPLAKDGVVAEDMAARRRKNAATEVKQLIQIAAQLEGPGAIPYGIERKWKKMRKALIRTLPNFDSTPELPPLGVLRAWHGELLTMIAVESAKTRDLRVSAWSDKLKRAMIRRDFRPVLEWCKEARGAACRISGPQLVR